MRAYMARVSSNELVLSVGEEVRRREDGLREARHGFLRGNSVVMW